jgi:subtilisin family serine protease
MDHAERALAVQHAPVDLFEKWAGNAEGPESASADRYPTHGRFTHRRHFFGRLTMAQAKKKAAPRRKPRGAQGRRSQEKPARIDQALTRMRPVKAASHDSLTVGAGADTEVQTVVYIHGIGNKPEASVLKCQWDTALFGVRLGDRSRMAYWVNREYYPVPSDESCEAGDTVRVDDDEVTTRSIMALSAATPVSGQAAVEREITALTSDRKQRETLRRISEKMTSKSVLATPALGAAGVRKKILPLPSGLRRIITRTLTRAFLRDVNDFLFVPERRKAMEESLLERLMSGGGPFVVVAHSQGTMIAYNVLRQLTQAQCDVRLFLTLGSPLGLDEVQDVLKQWTPDGVLRIPACVTRWVNAADGLDPVAMDSDIRNDFQPKAIENHLVDNPDSPRHPHSATGYLATKEVQEAVRPTASRAFAQAVGRSVVATDLGRDLENAHRGERHKTLIQLASDKGGAGVPPLAEVQAKVLEKLDELIRASGASPADAQIDLLKRFISARLTRYEVESLRTLVHDLHVERVWRNATKRALIHKSAQTVQTRPANLGYGASGENICWAVLDTGIRADHPHFELFQNVAQQWDCTKRGAPVAVTGKHSAELDKDGHGTHVAGIIAGYTEIPEKAGGPPIVYSGMAPRAKLYGFKVLADDGGGEDAWIIKALDLIADTNDKAGALVIHGVNLSLGGYFDPTVFGCGHTPLCQELRRLWGQGVLVVLAAGNEGYAFLSSADGDVPTNMDLTISDPANLEEAIAVGSIHKEAPHTYGISHFSSRGPTADGRCKPDVVAPGERVLSANHKFNKSKPKDKRVVDDLYVEMSGTSMAAPHVAGLLAAFLSLRREFIGYPDRVKSILFENCTDLGRDPYMQGKGMPNLIKMLANT